MRVMIERDWYRNPYLRELKGGLRELGVEIVDRVWIPYRQAVDVAHFHSEPCHWLKDSRLATLLKLGRFYVLVTVCRLRNIRITYTLHDLHPYSSAFRGWRRSLFFAVRRWFLSQVDGVVVHSRTSLAEIEKELKPGTRIFHIGHPMYLPTENRLGGSLRKTLHISPSAKVFLLFGDFRAHKDPHWFLQRYVQYADNNPDGLHLLVAGMSEQKAKADGRRNIHFLGSFIPEDRLPGLFEATDWVVLPYSEVTCSGVLHLAAAYNAAVLAADLPYFREIASSDGALFFRREEEEFARTLKQAIAMDTEQRAALAHTLRKRVENVRWPHLAVRCRDLYEEVLAPRNEPREDGSLRTR